MSEQPPAQTFSRLLGQRIRAIREAAGLTQSGLERAAGLRPTSIAAAERGESSQLTVEQLHDMAGVLGLPVTALLPTHEDVVRASGG
jgi:transcriptional regulator with XRE-family HTH domain